MFSSVFGNNRNSFSKKATDKGVIIRQGMFWKKGASVKSWKYRRYEIDDNCQLYYYDITTSPSTLKGTVDISEVTIRDGNPENIAYAVAAGPGIITKRFAIDITSGIDGRVLEAVFDSTEDLKSFLVGVFHVARVTNVVVSL